MVRARYLVGADGGRSLVRHALGLGFPGQTLGARAVVADVIAEGLERDAWHSWNAGDLPRRMMLCPLAGTDLFQLQAPVPPDVDVDTSAEGLTRLIQTRTGRDDIVLRRVDWASVYAMNARLADRYRVGRVLLAGDAAHIHPPTGGQGLNTSVQDAYNLGWKLAAVLGGAPDALLDSYEAERRPVAAGMLGLTTKLLDEARQGSMSRGREVHQLDIGYPGSPLALEVLGRAGAVAGVQAGDRAPDAPLRGAAGQPLRLFEVMKGPHWTLLGYHADPAAVSSRRGLRVHAVGPTGDLIDAHGHFRDAYGVRPGDWVLVRPDGYVGAVVPTEHLPALADHLRAVDLVRTA